MQPYEHERQERERRQRDAERALHAESPREPEAIQRDIAETRDAIDSTVDELGERLAPSRLMDDARSYVKESAMRGANSLWSTVSDNAVPLALIGGGVAWLIASHRRADGFEEPYYFHEDIDWEPAGAPHGATARAGEKAHELRERGRELGARARRRGEALGAQAQHRMHRVGSAARSMQDEQPLLVGVAALALGAVVAGALPATRREDELMGETRDQVVGAAVEAGRERAEEARERVHEAAQEASGRAGSEEARTGEGVGATGAERGAAARPRP